MFIKTDKFIIRRPKKSDNKKLLSLYQKKEVMKFIPNSDIDWDVEKVENKITKFQFESIGINLIEPLNGDFIGEASIFLFAEDENAYEIGFIVDDMYWGNGYGTSICNALIKYCKNNLNAKKVYARMFSDNIASQRVCSNNNMTITEPFLLMLIKKGVQWQFLLLSKMCIHISMQCVVTTLKKLYKLFF
ncbi:GNAT family N-acetyltransferase [Sphingobacterium kitahiroshimense]|uniref:GNAT family N-acetyltransferase n=1 Tax=Sphingobacterium kitahiroshimense TaxID=470446 RepID=A0ABV0BPJ3_9SPHI